MKAIILVISLALPIKAISLNGIISKRLSDAARESMNRQEAKSLRAGAAFPVPQEFFPAEPAQVASPYQVQAINQDSVPLPHYEAKQRERRQAAAYDPFDMFPEKGKWGLDDPLAPALYPYNRYAPRAPVASALNPYDPYAPRAPAASPFLPKYARRYRRSASEDYDALPEANMAGMPNIAVEVFQQVNDSDCCGEPNCQKECETEDE